MEQRNKEVGAEIAASAMATIAQADLDDLYLELKELLQAKTELQNTVRAQAQMFADRQRATPFEEAVREMVKKEFSNATLDLLKKLRAQGFFKE